MNGQLWAKSSFTLESPSASPPLRHRSRSRPNPLPSRATNRLTDFGTGEEYFFAFCRVNGDFSDTFRPRFEWRLFACGGDTRLWRTTKWRHVAFPPSIPPRACSFFKRKGASQARKSFPSWLVVLRTEWLKGWFGNNCSFSNNSNNNWLNSCLIKWWMKSYELLSNWFKFLFVIFVGYFF